METIEQLAPDAAQPGERNARNASPSRSIETASAGTAGTAAGKVANSSRISDRALAWAAERRIGQATLDALGVTSGMAFFPDLDRKSEALVFKYPVGWKARSFPEKSFVAGKGLKLAFWNIDCVLKAAPDRVFIVEGELDALVLVEAGIPVSEVLSVPNGARKEAADDPHRQHGYGYVEEALKAGLSRIKRFVWCGDNDAQGRALRTDMVRLLGAARFYFVEWPEGAKDANALLISDGPEAVRGLVEEGALPWPVAGLYRMSELPEPPPMTLWHPGFPEWESKVRLASNTLSVVTGHPGHGKTALWGQIWFQVAKAYDLRICVASFETRPRPHLRRQLRSLFCGALERDLRPEEIADADAWINEHYLFLVHPEQKPDLNWLLDTAEIAVVRHGASVLQVDPWNRLEGQRERNESETDYIGRCLRSIHGFAHDLNTHFQILAHPAKMDSTRRGQPPALEDISGSKHWDNMVDQGFVVHRPEIFDGSTRKTEAKLYHRKTRFEELGHPCALNLNYRLDRGRYVSIDYEPAQPKQHSKTRKGATG
jgi:twinkle protein